MSSVPGRLRKRLFGISPGEVTFERRGFAPADPQVQRRLEQIGGTFVFGYHAALEQPDPSPLAALLRSVDEEFQGFAFEGAAMALALLDSLTPWHRDRLRAFLAGPGEPHSYMVLVGAGWALARLRRRVERPLARLHPLLGWLAVDGYGFHEGYFHPQLTVEKRRVPKRLRGYARRVFDQGLGRSLWFSKGADVGAVAETVGGFDAERRSDLWSGVGLACAYAGCVARPAMEALRRAAGWHRPALAQGVAFAAKARLRAGNPARHTELACETICDMPADVAAKLTDTARQNLSPGGEWPAFEMWRQRIQAHFAEEETGA